MKRLKLYHILRGIYEHKQLGFSSLEAICGNALKKNYENDQEDSDIYEQVLSSLKLEENMVDKFEEFTKLVLNQGTGGIMKDMFEPAVPKNIDIDGVDLCVNYFK